MFREWLLTLLAFVAATTGESFADWMTKDFCDRELAVGQVIMNNKVEASDDRFIRVFRGDEELMSGSRYHHSELLTVSISNTHDQFVYEALGGAIFEKGGCDGKRVADKPQALLKMPISGEENVRVVAGWATGHQAVSVTPSFILIPEAWNDRRDDSPEKSKAASDIKEPDQHLAAEKRDQQPPRELDGKTAGADRADSAKIEKAEKIPEPQEDLYAHDLHKDEDHDAPRADPHHLLSIRDDPENEHKGEIKYNTPHKVGHDEPQVVRPEDQQQADHFHLHLKDEAHRSHNKEDVDMHLHDMKKRRDHILFHQRENHERQRDDDVKHPHSNDPRDHDPFDMQHKRMMDRVRDRERERDLFQGGHEGEAEGEGGAEGEGEAVPDEDPRIEEIIEEETGIHRAGKVKRIAVKGKRALRGGATYSQYVRSHTVLIGECFMAGTFIVFVGYRLFASRFKIHRYFKKIKGMEEK